MKNNNGKAQQQKPAGGNDKSVEAAKAQEQKVTAPQTVPAKAAKIEPKKEEAQKQAETTSPSGEQQKQEEAKPEAPKADEKKEEAKAEEPKKEDVPKQEQQKQEEPPKQEEAKDQEPPKQEAKPADKADVFTKTLAEIKKMVPSSFSAKENKSGVTWFGNGKTRLLKLVETRKGLRIEFNVEVSKVDGLEVLTTEQAKEKHMGTCRWIYTGSNMESVKKLVKEAIGKFAPKKRSDAVEIKEEKPKEEAADGKVSTRQLTEEELKKLNATSTKSDQQKEAAVVKSLQNQQQKAQ